MNPTSIIVTTLAFVTASLPFQASAREARKNSATLETARIERLSMSSDVVLSPAHSDGSDLAVAPFAFRLLDGAAFIKSRSMSLDWQTGSLTLNIMRAKSLSRSHDLVSFNFNQFAVMVADIGLVKELDGRDSLSIGTSYALENRRPSINIAAHNIYRTSNAAVTLGWTHDGNFRLSSSLYSTAPVKVRSQPERLVELAGGAPLAARGLSLTASFSPDHDPTHLSYGLDLRAQRLAPSDAQLVGSSSARSDARIGIFLRKSF
jgi:hypothetical protein